MFLPLIVTVAVMAAAEKPTLRGIVEGPDGVPLVGAQVLIFTARPRVGTSTYCPSCYLDCGRRATTDAEGRFEISDLDPTLLFQIVAMATGREAVFQENVDPAATPVELSLPPTPPLPEEPKRVLKGQVVGPLGPVASAIVEPQGFSRGESKMFGPIGVSPTVTDGEGRFQMGLREEVDSVVLTLTPRGLTRRTYDRVPTGMARNTLAVSYGAGVRGRVVKDGRPLSGIAVNMDQQNRDASRWVGTSSATTNEAGQFLIANVLPEEPMVIVASSETLGPLGYVPSRQLTTGADGTITDVGDLDARAGHQVAGRVVLSDAAVVPAHTRLTVAREDVDDPQTVELEADGSFKLKNVPEGVVSLSVRVPGYVASKRNASLPPLRSSLIGRVDHDLSLTVLLERGSPPDRITFDAESSKAERALRQKPLAGVEAKPE